MVGPVDPVILAMERNWEMINGDLEGLDEGAMARQRTDQCNSVAWILWHLTRVTDMFIHPRLRDLTQVSISEEWHDLACPPTQKTGVWAGTPPKSQHGTRLPGKCR
ncbi:MAG: DinB family protein [SAR202 cluster bacterium]|nr:DinB family protein [SAR202 cluster bacterium]